MTPQEFAEKMNNLKSKHWWVSRNRLYDMPEVHEAADSLVSEALHSAGYGRGAEVYDFLHEKFYPPYVAVNFDNI